MQELHQDQGAFEESSSLAFVVLTKQVKSLKEAYSQLADSFLEEMERVHSLVRAAETEHAPSRKRKACCSFVSPLGYKFVERREKESKIKQKHIFLILERCKRVHIL